LTEKLQSSPVETAAQRFVQEGAYVFITGRRQNELDKAVKQIGRNVMDVQGDVSNLADLDRRDGKAAEGPDQCPLRKRRILEVAPLGSITEEQFDKTFDINVKGYSPYKRRFHCFRTVVLSF
jgi:NAD(P)-dependent dehydrogenase (short-subunit alcohol dehydrogenase family)